MSRQPGLVVEDGPFRPLEGRSLKFACHPGVSCFNECCADLKLALTPYDILRLKNRLNISSDQFLETYVVDDPESQGRFPRVLLKMGSSPRRPCPFVTPDGCSVYEDRPGACRTYPLGRGSAKGGREMFFVVQEDHCQGFQEDKVWDIDEWLADQGLTPYNQMNDQWMEVITSRASLGAPEQIVRKVQMFYMASYNLDRFRSFVFQSRFLEMFALPSGMVDQVRRDETALLTLAFNWLRFALFGEKTLIPKSD